MRRAGGFLTTLAGVAMLAGAGAGHAVTVVTLSTSQTPFDEGVGNQGWWSDTHVASDDNDNYLTGFLDDGVAPPTTGADDHRSFFTFDLAHVPVGLGPLQSARLELRRFGSSSGNEDTETLAFFDVSTDAKTLNDNANNDAAIYMDLGTGTSYGSFDVPGSGSDGDTLSFDLDAAAITDIAAGLGGFFSIGGALTSQDGDDWLFGSLDPVGPQELELTFAEAEPEPVPAPATVALLAAGLAGLGRRARRASARAAAPGTC